jgi:hypothetical protein
MIKYSVTGLQILAVLNLFTIAAGFSLENLLIIGLGALAFTLNMLSLHLTKLIENG